MPLGGRPQRPGPAVGLDDLAVAHELDLEGARPRPLQGLQRLPALAGGDDQLLDGGPRGVQDPSSPLAPADGGLAPLGELGDLLHDAVCAGPLDELVDQRRRRAPRTGDELGPHAVGVHRGGPQAGDGVLVQVVGHRDPRARGAQGVELGAGLEGLGHQVARVQAHRPQLPAAGAGRGHGPLDAPGDVVGVDQDRRARPQRGDLRCEGLLLGVVQEREGVGGGAHRGDAVAHARLQVARAGEAAHDGGAGGGHGGVLVGAARPELHAGPPVRGDGHAGGRRGDGAVVVVDGQRQGLQDAGLGEGPLDREQGGAGEVALALGVTADRAGEAVVAQVVQGGVVDHLRGAQEVDLGGREGEGLDGVEKAPRPGHDAVAARGGQFAPEQLEDAAALRGARAQGALQHRQLVLVGEQGR